MNKLALFGHYKGVWGSHLRSSSGPWDGGLEPQLNSNSVHFTIINYTVY